MNKLRNIIAATAALGLIAGGCGEANPAAVETESGALGIDLPEWEAGQL